MMRVYLVHARDLAMRIVKRGRGLRCVPVLLLLLLSACAPSREQKLPPEAVDGLLDLRGWDLAVDDAIPLRGEWDFVFGAYLSAEQIDTHPRRHVIHIPSTWKNVEYDGVKLPTDGYATYRLKLLTRAGQELAIKTPQVMSSHRVYVNGNLLYSIGVAGVARESSQPSKRRDYKAFAVHSDTVQIVVHVANFHYRKGGILQAPVLGTATELRSATSRALVFDAFIVGGLFLCAVMLFTFYLSRRSDAVWLNIGLICFSGFVRAGSTSEIVFLQLWPSLPWEWLIRLELGSFYVFYYFFYKTTYSLYPEEASRGTLRGAASVAGFALLVLITTPARFHSQFVLGMQAASLIGFSLIVFEATRAVKRRREGALLYLSVFIIMALLMFTEVAYLYNVVSFAFPSMASFLVIAVMTMILLARRYGYAFRRIESFAGELEQTVEQRTQELRSAQVQLVHQEKMAALGQLTAGIAHEIKNPLNFVNNFAAVSTELVDEALEDIVEGRDARDTLDLLRTNLTKIHEHGARADSIVKNMMLHARGGASEKRDVHINALLSETADLAYHSARARIPDFNTSIERVFETSLPPVQAQPQELGRVFMNLVNNAIDAVHARASEGEQGYAPRILLRTRLDRGYVEIAVIDNGHGVPAAARANLFQPFFTTKPAGVGTGLGLSISHDIIVTGHGGELFLDTTVADGAAFVVRIPL